MGHFSPWEVAAPSGHLGDLISALVGGAVLAGVAGLVWWRS